MKPAEIRKHWNEVIDAGPHPALIHHSGRLTIHHCHGGSISEMGIHRGMSKKPSDWLVVCLPASIHCAGIKAIDYGFGVQSWEKEFMPQAQLLEWTSRRLGVNVFKKAGFNIEIPGMEVSFRLQDQEDCEAREGQLHPVCPQWGNNQAQCEIIGKRHGTLFGPFKGLDRGPINQIAPSRGMLWKRRK